MDRKQINSVKGLKVGQVFNVEGENYIVTDFPTRYSVCGDNKEPSVGKPNSIKTSINHTKTLFWQHCDSGNIICPTNPV